MVDTPAVRRSSLPWKRPSGPRSAELASPFTLVARGPWGLALLLTGGFAVVPALGGASDFLGAYRCRSCHPAEYQQWRQTPHARTFERLTAEQRRDPRCTACHATAAADGHLGVQCESCHGAGRDYIHPAVMRDRALARAIGLRRGDDASMCRRCHTPDAPRILPFDHAAALPAVRHLASPGAR